MLNLGITLARGKGMSKTVAWSVPILAWLLAGTAVHAGERHYYYTDPQGTLLAKADAAGNIIDTSDYRPYGAGAVGATEGGPGYTGHVNDADSGLVYMQARYYDPMTGRFLSVDPIVPAAAQIFNINRYAYGNDNPIVNIDPTGMCVGLRGLMCRNFASDGDSGGNEPNVGSDDGSQQQKPTLPSDPSGLGGEWKDITPQGGTNPKIPKRYRGPKGSEIEFDPADPSKPANTWGGKNHWHDVNPDTGKRQGGHLPPGSPIPGPDGVPTSSNQNIMDRMRSITPDPIAKLGTTAVVIYIVISEGSRVIPVRNLAPVP